MDSTEENDTIARRGIVKSDVDPQGNVVLWDHGPTEPGPDVERDGEEYKRREVEAKVWHRKNGGGPIPVIMDQSNAAHAMSADPERYSLEPADVSESDIEAEIAKIQEQRDADKKVAEERAAALQLASDRKAAIAIVQGRRAAELAAARAPNLAPPEPPDTSAAPPATQPRPAAAPTPTVQPAPTPVPQPQPVVIPPQPKPGNV